MAYYQVIAPFLCAVFIIFDEYYERRKKGIVTSVSTSVMVFIGIVFMFFLIYEFQNIIPFAEGWAYYLILIIFILFLGVWQERSRFRYIQITAMERKEVVEKVQSYLRMRMGTVMIFIKLKALLIN